MAELSNNVKVTLTVDAASYERALESLRSEFATLIQSLRDEVAAAIQQITDAKAAPTPQTHHYHINSTGGTDPKVTEAAVRRALHAHPIHFAIGGPVDAIGKPLPGPDRFTRDYVVQSSAHDSQDH